MLTTPSRRSISQAVLPNKSEKVYRSGRWLLPAALLLSSIGGVAAGGLSPAAPAQAAATRPAVSQSAAAGAPSAKSCTVDAKLVPTCGMLWGVAPGGFSDVAREEALTTWEKTSGQPTNVYHAYYRGDQLFPTKKELPVARDPKNPRLLLLNWKVAWGSTWAKVAAGQQNARIDRLAKHIKSTFPEKFFMVLHHEPENDVNPKAGSGMTAKDFAAMYRHTVKRLKANGVNNAVFVVSYMNYEKWNNSSWWQDLYPGDDVVDWLGLDSYVNAQPKGFHNGDFSYLMNRTNDAKKFPGWYNWATTKHPSKPLMLSEWGIYDSSKNASPTNKASLFDTVLPQLAKFPKLKGLVYFDTKSDQAGRDIRIDQSKQSLAAFRKIAADPRFRVSVR